MSDPNTPLPLIEDDNGEENKPRTHGDDVAIEAPATLETSTAASKRERESGESPPRHRRKLDHADDVNDEDGDEAMDIDEPPAARNTPSVNEAVVGSEVHTAASQLVEDHPNKMTEEAQSKTILEPAPTKLTVKTWTDHNDLVWDPAKKVPLRSLPKKDGDGLTGISKGKKRLFEFQDHHASEDTTPTALIKEIIEYFVSEINKFQELTFEVSHDNVLAQRKLQLAKSDLLEAIELYQAAKQELHEEKKRNAKPRSSAEPDPDSCQAKCKTLEKQLEDLQKEREKDHEQFKEAKEDWEKKQREHEARWDDLRRRETAEELKVQDWTPASLLQKALQDVAVAEKQLRQVQADALKDNKAKMRLTVELAKCESKLSEAKDSNFDLKMQLEDAKIQHAKSQEQFEQELLNVKADLEEEKANPHKEYHQEDIAEIVENQNRCHVEEVKTMKHEYEKEIEMLKIENKELKSKAATLERHGSGSSRILSQALFDAAKDAMANDGNDCGWTDDDVLDQAHKYYKTASENWTDKEFTPRTFDTLKSIIGVAEQAEKPTTEDFVVMRQKIKIQRILNFWRKKDYLAAWDVACSPPAANATQEMKNVMNYYRGRAAFAINRYDDAILAFSELRHLADCNYKGQNFDALQWIKRARNQLCGPSDALKEALRVTDEENLGRRSGDTNKFEKRPLAS